MDHEPAKRRQIAHMALRNFERLEPPLTLELMPRLRKARCDVVGLAAPPNDQRPVLLDKRLRHEWSNLSRCPLAERLETRSVKNRSLLEGRVRGRRAVESHRFQRWLAGRAARDADRGRLHGIAVDLQVDRHGAMFA